MAISEFETEDELDDAADEFEQKMRDEVYLKDAIGRAHERVAAANDELNEAEEELRDLVQQLADLGL